MKTLGVFFGGVAVGVVVAISLLAGSRIDTRVAERDPGQSAAISPRPPAPVPDTLPPNVAPANTPPNASAWPTPSTEPLVWPSPVPGDSTDHLTPPDLKNPDRPDVSDFTRLQSRALRLPVEGYALSGLRDNFAEKRGARVHEAIDILAPRGTPVLAVDDGVVKKLFTSAAGGLTVYEFDPSQEYAYYYAHLDRYAEGLAEGKFLRKGDRVGYVGTTGNAPPGTPHLHFTIYKLGSDKRWWEGTPINPYPLWALR